MAFALLTPTAAPAVGAPGQERWVHQAPDLNACGGIVASDSSMVIVGSEFSQATRRDGTVVSYDRIGGSVDWRFVYDGSAHRSDLLDRIAASPDGSTVFAAGYEMDVNKVTGALLIALDAATGDPLWTYRRWDPFGIRGQSALVTDLIVAPDGAAVYVSEWYFAQDGTWDSLTEAIDAATGEMIWMARFSRLARLQSDDLLHAIAVSPAGGRVFVGGESYFPERSAVLAYDAATGERIWTRLVNERATYDLAAGSGVVVALSDAGSVLRSLAAPNGSNRWAQVLPRREWYRQITADPATAAVFAVGARRTETTQTFLMAAYGGSGAREWKESYVGGGTAPDQGMALALSPDGSGVYATGYQDGQLDAPASQADALTLKRDAATGQLSWAAVTAGAGDAWDAGAGVAIPSDGSVVGVCGSSPTPYDGAFTAAYEG